jgi:hypothetical protein
MHAPHGLRLSMRAECWDGHSHAYERGCAAPQRNQTYFAYLSVVELAGAVGVAVAGVAGVAGTGAALELFSSP